MRNLGKEFCNILFLQVVGDFTKAVVAHKEHVFLGDICAEGASIYKLHRERWGSFRQVEFLKAGGVSKVDNRVGVYLNPVFLCKMVQGKAEPPVAAAYFYNVYLGQGEAA